MIPEIIIYLRINEQWYQTQVSMTSFLEIVGQADRVLRCVRDPSMTKWTVVKDRMGGMDSNTVSDREAFTVQLQARPLECYEPS